MQTTSGILTLAMCLIIQAASYGQDYASPAGDDESPSFLQLNEALISSGGLLEYIPAAGQREFAKLAPGSSILARDISRFSQFPGVYVGGNAVSLQAGFSIRRADGSGYHPGRTLRLGFHYFSQQRYGYSSFNTVTTPWDTLTSSQTGDQFLVDSAFTETYTFQHWVDHMRLDAALVFRTVRESRWSWFGGVGMTFGPSLLSESFVERVTSRRTRIRDYGSGYDLVNTETDAESERENYTLNTVLGGSLYIPAGVDFRIGKQREFWKPIHLFYEVRPQILYTRIPELGNSARTGIQQAIGLRVRWK